MEMTRNTSEQAARYGLAYTSDLLQFTREQIESLVSGPSRKVLVVPRAFVALAHESVQQAAIQIEGGASAHGCIWEEFVATLPLIVDVAQIERPAEGYSPSAEALLRFALRECSKVRTFDGPALPVIEAA